VKARIHADAIKALPAALIVSVFLVCVAIPDGHAQTRVPRTSLVLTGTIPLEGVEGRMDHLAVDAKSERLFVAALENHTVEVNDLARRKREFQLTGISEPQGLAFVTEKNRLLVCSRGDGTCRSFDARNFSEGPWIDLGRNADNIRLDPAARLIYVGSGGEPGNGLLSAIDVVALVPPEQGGRASQQISSADLRLDRPKQARAKMEIPLPAHPESLQLDPARRRVFVNVPDDHLVEVLEVSPTSLTLAASWPITFAEANFPMALDTNSSRLFIACRKPAKVGVYNADTGKLLSQAPCVGDADDMFYDGKRNQLYVIGGEGFLDVFQVLEGTNGPVSLAHVPTAAHARTGLFLPSSDLLVVATPHTRKNPAALMLFQVKP
jgi:hypothetical protein